MVRWTWLASLKCQFQGVQLCLMKGGNTSTHGNGLLMGDSSARLNTSIRSAVIAAELLRCNLVTEQVVSRRVTGGWKTVHFLFLINEAGWIKCNLIYIQSPTSICSALRRRCTEKKQKLFTPKGSFRGCTAAHLERLKPARPEWVASSMSGVTMRSIMSVSTVKVGTTM